MVLHSHEFQVVIFLSIRYDREIRDLLLKSSNHFKIDDVRLGYSIRFKGSIVLGSLQSVNLIVCTKTLKGKSLEANHNYIVLYELNKISRS
jgi:hypothetical protein